MFIFGREQTGIREAWMNKTSYTVVKALPLFGTPNPKHRLRALGLFILDAFLEAPLGVEQWSVSFWDAFLAAPLEALTPKKGSRVLRQLSEPAGQTPGDRQLRLGG